MILDTKYRGKVGIPRKIEKENKNGKLQIISESFAVGFCSSRSLGDVVSNGEVDCFYGTSLAKIAASETIKDVLPCGYIEFGRYRNCYRFPCECSSGLPCPWRSLKGMFSFKLSAFLPMICLLQSTAQKLKRNIRMCDNRQKYKLSFASVIFTFSDWCFPLSISINISKMENKISVSEHYKASVYIFRKVTRSRRCICQYSDFPCPWLWSRFFVSIYMGGVSVCGHLAEDLCAGIESSKIKRNVGIWISSAVQIVSGTCDSFFFSFISALQRRVRKTSKDAKGEYCRLKQARKQ